MTPGPAVRVVCVDDDPLVRRSVQDILEAEADIEVVGQAENGLAALACCASTDPDVVLMDLRMPVLDGLRATARLVARAGGRQRVLVLTTFGDEDNLYGALRAGASGFVLKSGDPAQLVNAVRLVAHGDTLVLPVSSRRLLANQSRATHGDGNSHARRVERLTAREAETLRLMSHGLPNADIAARLGIGAETVKTHVSAVLRKLAARDRTHAVVIAFESGFARGDDQ